MKLVGASNIALKRGSIGAKLLGLVSLVVAGTVLALTVNSVRRESQTYIQHTYSSLSANAHIIGVANADAVARQDRMEILQHLTVIGKLPDIHYVEVYDRAESSLAQLGDGTLVQPRNLQLSDGSAPGLFKILNSHTLSVSEPIYHSGQKIGSIIVYGHTSKLKTRLYGMVIDTFVLAIAILGSAILLTLIMQRSVVGPITRLTRVMDKIQITEDYSHPLKETGDDETGRLIRSFNTMLGKLHERDARLSRYSAELQEEVAARTSELEAAKNEAERANRAKSDFLAVMSHEIRTPLNGMLAIAELLAKAPLADRQKKHASIILNSGRSLLTIINDILDLSKVESGKLDLELIDFSPQGLMEETMMLFEEKASSKGLSLSVDLSGYKGGHMVGDPVRIRQVMNNFTNNALKFTDKGSIRLILSTLEQGENGSVLYFAVEDQGIGIPEDKQARVFEAFSQADQSTTRKYGGTGLGLAICERLVNAMKGRIGVKSRVGVGSRFWFAIPVGHAKAPVLETPPTEEAIEVLPVISSASSSKVLRILVADDNPINQEVVREALADQHCKVDAVGDGRAAVAARKAQEYDIIFMDGSMPEMDGPSATRMIRGWELVCGEYRTTIVALTADAAGQSRQAWAEAGVDDYILKPFTLDQIVACVNHFAQAAPYTDVKAA